MMYMQTEWTKNVRLTLWRGRPLGRKGGGLLAGMQIGKVPPQLFCKEHSHSRVQCAVDRVLLEFAPRPLRGCQLRVMPPAMVCLPPCLQRLCKQ